MFRHNEIIFGILYKFESNISEILTQSLYKPSNYYIQLINQKNCDFFQKIMS